MPNLRIARLGKIKYNSYKKKSIVISAPSTLIGYYCIWTRFWFKENFCVRHVIEKYLDSFKYSNIICRACAYANCTLLHTTNSRQNLLSFLVLLCVEILNFCWY